MDAFADITDVEVVAIDWADAGQLRVTFDGDLTDVQALAVRLRITSCDDADEARRVAAARFLLVESPSLADVARQVRRLTSLLLSLDDAE